MANAVSTIQTSDSKTATYNTDSIDCLDYKEIAVHLNVTNVSGSSPTLDVVLEHSTDDENWETLYTFSQVTAVASAQIYIPNDTQFGFMRYVRAACTIGGSSPNFTLSIIAVTKE